MTAKAVTLERRLALDAARVFSAQSLATAAGIIAGIVLVRTLGPAGKGALGYATSALALATTGFSGVTTAAMLAIARQHGSRDAVVNATLRIAMIAGCVLILPVLAIAVTLPAQRPLAAAALAVIPALIGYAATTILQYERRISPAIVSQQIGTTGFALVGSAVALGGGGIVGVFVAWVVMQSIGAIVAVRALGTHRADVQSGLSAVVARVAIIPTLLQIAAYLTFTIDLYVVAALRTQTDLGIYALAIGAGQMLWQVSRAIVWPAFGPIADLPPPESAALAARLCARTLLLVVPIAALAWFAAPLAIALVYGSAFAPSGDLVRIVLPGVVAMAAEAPIGAFLLMRADRAAALLVIQVTATVLCAVICVVGMPRYGLAAAAWGTSISYVLAFVGAAVVAMREGLPLPSRI